ncbi:anaerobic ribonucleoside-triphosphate reductase activating protein [Desulfobulbus elongatus]|uniref:anaerobic ribonucleoside-triphosphate reductase activating protein n=1 Tax=Desulfobulbus elongatus TaxID=53332 RepID=UPI0004857FDA|nr:anaerobic ribonucleoside-triphosphate reductase activating protein [Desulfobulbus elongatus]
MTAHSDALAGLVIGGCCPASFIDFPGRVAAVVFFQGCGFRCPYCHNPQLIPRKPAGAYAPAEVLDRLAARRGKLGGVVVSGGEPTLQPALPQFCAAVRAMGYPVKLDTNGSRPDLLAGLLAQGLVNYVAMDLKAPPARYALLAGTRVDVGTIFRSAALIAASGVEHHFRTTYDRSLLTPEDVQLIREMVPTGSRYVVQPCR